MAIRNSLHLYAPPLDLRLSPFDMNRLPRTAKPSESDPAQRRGFLKLKVDWMETQTRYQTLHNRSPVVIGPVILAHCRWPNGE